MATPAPADVRIAPVTIRPTGVVASGVVEFELDVDVSTNSLSVVDAIDDELVKGFSEEVVVEDIGVEEEVGGWVVEGGLTIT